MASEWQHSLKTPLSPSSLPLQHADTTSSRAKWIKIPRCSIWHPFCLFCFHLLGVAFHRDQFTNPLHSGITSQMREHINKHPHPIQMLRPWIYGLMLELCHSTVVYDTNNLLWQLTATRQIFLLPCLSSRSGGYASASSPALTVVLILLPGGTSWWSKLIEKYSFFCLASYLPLRLAQWGQGQAERRSRKCRGQPMVSSAP